MEIPLKLTIQGLEYSDPLEKRIRDQVESLEKSCSRIERCRVAVEFHQKRAHDRKRYTVEIDVTLPGHAIIVTKDRDEDVYVALRDAIDGVRKELDQWIRKGKGPEKVP